MRSALLAALLLTACAQPTTVVTIAVDGTPVQGTEVVILPYDRDSILAALGARAPTPQPDPAPLVALLDSMGQAYAALAAAPAGDPRARQALDARRAALEPRIEALRAEQHRWRDMAWKAYDSVTYDFTRKLARDPFSDTTDTEGIVSLRPPQNGRWWVTVRAWNIHDPYSEWYWNLPLAGDTIHLTTANAQRLPRI